MRYKFKIILTALLLMAGLSSMAQEEEVNYNPFIPANLDDPAKLPVNTVVEGSYHRYWIYGDANYTDGSTFIWYVENGRFGTYDAATDTWTPNASAQAQGNGYRLVLPFQTVNGTANSSEIWVKWDQPASSTTGYVAAYERSSNNCIENNMIKGFKHHILLPPEVWFAENSRQECADQSYTVELHFNHIDTLSYPYTVYYTRPDGLGNIVNDTLTVEKYGLATLGYFLDFELVQELSPTVDEGYQITLTSIRDKFGTEGKVAPRPTEGQYAIIDLKILHLPQTGTMQMD